MKKLGLRGFIIRRSIVSLLLIFIVATLNFTVFRLIPGNPLYIIGAKGALTPEQLQQLEIAYGFTKPIWLQYFLYIQNLFTGNWGISFVSNLPVVQEIASRLLNTLILVGSALLISGVIGMVIGLKAAQHHNSKFFLLLVAIGLILFAVPVFWLGVIFQETSSVYLGILPVQGTTSVPPPSDLVGYVIDYLDHLISPMLVLSLSLLGGGIILVRGSVMDEFSKDYVTVSIAKGMGENKVLFGHVLKNSLLPIITYTAMYFGVILSGALLVEVVFSWNGLGTLIFRSILALDYPTLQATFFLISITVILSNLVADIAYGYLDPRVRVS